MSNQNNDDLNTRLARMLDTNDIKAIAHRFARGLDRCDRALIESCFHPDGLDDHGFFKGTAPEFCDWVMKELTKFTVTQHIVSTQNVDLNGDSAVSESYFYAYHIMPTPDGDKELIASGRYIDSMEKRDGEWKITLRRAVFDWNKMTDAAPLPAPENDPRMLGGKHPDDVSYQAIAELQK